MKVLLVFVFMAIGNFAYQFFYPESNFLVAFERTWFQGSALLTYWLMDKFVWSDWR